MKGIKTEVKTEWKNLAHGNTRKYDFRSGEKYIQIRGIKDGDTIQLSYTCHWRLEDEEIGSVIQCTNTKNEYPLGLWRKGKPGVDNVAHYKSSWKVQDNTERLNIYSPKWDLQYGAKKDKESYVIIENVMANVGDKPLPYIDSDELKATGGAIVSILFIMLATSMRKEVAA